MRAHVDASTRVAELVEELKVIACRICGASEWGFETKDRARCRKCYTVLSVEDRVLRFDVSSDTASLIAGWNAYYDQKADVYSPTHDWWTLSSWRKHLFAPVLGRLPGKMVVDVGCGAAVRVATLAPLTQFRYRYIGIDSSLTALERAAGNMPGGLFVCTDLSQLRLQAHTVDVVLCLGVLMYFPRLEPLLSQMLGALKPGGLLLLHEKLRRRSWGKAGGYASTAGPASPPDGYCVQEAELRVFLAQHGRVKNIHRSGSPFRSLAMPLLDRKAFLAARPLAAWLDSLWCRSVGRVVPDLGPGEIQLVFQKQGNV